MQTGCSTSSNLGDCIQKVAYNCTEAGVFFFGRTFDLVSGLLRICACAVSHPPRAVTNGDLSCCQFLIRWCILNTSAHELVCLCVFRDNNHVKTAACYDAQQPSPPLLLQIQRRPESSKLPSRSEKPQNRIATSVAHILVPSALKAATQFVLQPQYTDNPENMRVGVLTTVHFKVVVRNFHALKLNK